MYLACYVSRIGGRIKEIEEKFHSCPSCGKEVSDERKELLGMDTCPNCTIQPNSPLGVMDYSSKQAGVLMLISDPKMFRMLKKPINQQR